MTDIKKIEKAVFDTIEQLNRQLPPNKRLNKATDELIIDQDSKLDSLGLVNFLVGCEQNLESETGQKLILTSDEAFSGADGSFGTVGNLIEYISTKLS